MNSEEVKPVVEEKKENVFQKLVTLLTSDSEKKLSLPIDPKVLAVLKTILEKNPSALSATFESILSDGKLDSKDIPKLVLLVTQLRTTEFPTINSDLLVSLVQLLIHSLIEFEFVKVDDKEVVIEMLDVSLSLLKTTLEGVPAVNIRSCCF